LGPQRSFSAPGVHASESVPEGSLSGSAETLPCAVTPVAGAVPIVTVAVSTVTVA